MSKSVLFDQYTVLQISSRSTRITKVRRTTKSGRPAINLEKVQKSQFLTPSYRHNAASATMTCFDVHIELFEIYLMMYWSILNSEYFHDLTLNQFFRENFFQVSESNLVPKFDPFRDLSVELFKIEFRKKLTCHLWFSEKFGLGYIKKSKGIQSVHILIIGVKKRPIAFWIDQGSKTNAARFFELLSFFRENKPFLVKLMFWRFDFFSKVLLNNFLCRNHSILSNLSFCRSRRDLQESVKNVERPYSDEHLLTLKVCTFRPIFAPKQGKRFTFTGTLYDQSYSVFYALSNDIWVYNVTRLGHAEPWNLT
jgi:hypothetical protein